jgi:type IV pilus assembly protein PilC
MPRYWYTAGAGDPERKIVDADDLPEALLKLRSSGITVTSAGVEEPPHRRARILPRRAQATVYPQLAALLDDGTPLPTALRQLALETRDRQIQRSLHALADAADRGATLSDAMSAQPSAYDLSTVHSVAASEAAGDLPEGLRRLNDHQEEMARLAEQVAFPLIYPVVITFIVFDLLLFLVTFIVPKFLALYRELGMTEDKFPIPTIMLMRLCAIAPWAIFIVGVPAVCLIIAYRLYTRTSRGQFDVKRWGLLIPLLGQLSLYTSLGRVASVLGLLLRQGVDTGKALRIAGEASGSATIGLALRRAASVVNEGGSLADGLRASGILPEAFVFSLGAAEIGGQVPATLTHLVEVYQRRARWLTRVWITATGPIIVVCLGAMVSFIGIGLFAPLIGIIGELSQ